MIFSINFNSSVILFFIFLKTATCPNVRAASIIEPDIQNYRLTGAFRPAEIAMKFNISKQKRYYTQSYGKYMVSIRRSESNTNFGQSHFCGGVIIRTNLILTAAHCFVRNRKIMQPSSIRVVAKTPFRLRKVSATQIVRVKKIVVHELFLSSTPVDIALLKLKKHITLEENDAAVLALPTKRTNASTICAVSGWGRLYLNGPMANEILQIDVTLHSKGLCKIFFLKFNNSKICASNIFDGEKNPCSGDSGGPLICNGVLTGIVSYGFQCRRGYPTVYTDVYEQRSWIKENNSDTLKFFHLSLWAVIVVVIILKNSLIIKLNA